MERRNTVKLNPLEMRNQGVVEDLRSLGIEIEERNFTTGEKVRLVTSRVRRFWPYLPLHPRRVLEKIFDL